MGRSRAKKPTRRQKILMQSANLVPKKLAGAEGNRNRASCSEPRIGEGKNRKEIADVSENKKPIRRK